MAYKISKNSQTSYAYGKYFQTPELGFDQWYRRNNIDFDSFENNTLEFEKSVHHILNYEWSKNIINKYGLNKICTILFSPLYGKIEIRQIAECAQCH